MNLEKEVRKRAWQSLAETKVIYHVMELGDDKMDEEGIKGYPLTADSEENVIFFFTLPGYMRDIAESIGLLESCVLLTIDKKAIENLRVEHDFTGEMYTVASFHVYTDMIKSEHIKDYQIYEFPPKPSPLIGLTFEVFHGEHAGKQGKVVSVENDDICIQTATDKIIVKLQDINKDWLQ